MQIRANTFHFFLNVKIRSVCGLKTACIYSLTPLSFHSPSLARRPILFISFFFVGLFNVCCLAVVPKGPSSLCNMHPLARENKCMRRRSTEAETQKIFGKYELILLKATFVPFYLFCVESHSLASAFVAIAILQSLFAADIRTKRSAVMQSDAPA